MEENTVESKKLLVVTSAVKAHIKKHFENMRVGGDVAQALHETLLSLLTSAALRAKANGRGTVQAKDV